MKKIVEDVLQVRLTGVAPVYKIENGDRSDLHAYSTSGIIDRLTNGVYTSYEGEDNFYIIKNSFMCKIENILDNIIDTVAYNSDFYKYDLGNLNSKDIALLTKFTGLTSDVPITLDNGDYLMLIDNDYLTLERY